MPNETGQVDGNPIFAELCGRCGARVEQDVELCAACGALLSAYKTPVVTADQVPAPADGIGTTSSPSKTVRTEPLPRTPFQSSTGDQPISHSSATRGAESRPELEEARADLLTTMLEPERRLVTTMQAEIQPDPPTEKPPDGASSPPKRAAVTPLSAPVTLPTKRHSDHSAANRPRKPGFVAIGSIEPVIMIGSAIFVIAVIVGLLSSVGLFSFGSIVALALGTVGIFTIILAMLVALVRKDQDRR